MFRAELIGLTTTIATRIAAAIAVAGLVLTQLVFVTLLPALARGDIGPGAAALGEDLPVVDLTTATAQLDALDPLGMSTGGGSIGIALVAIVLFGVLAGTSDDRYGGIVGAVLASPRRSRLVIAKAAAVAAGGAALGLVMSVAAFITLAATLTVAGIPIAVGAAEATGTLGRGVLAVTCLSVIGLAVGILCRTQLAGVLVMITVLVAEPVVTGVSQLVGGGTASGWTAFLPLALTGSVIHGGGAVLPAVPAIAALLALTAAVLSAASVALTRRDV